MVPEEFDEIQKICRIECSVFECQEPLQIWLAVMQAEIIRRIVHALHQLLCFIDDDGPVAPCESSGKEARDLYILFFGEPVRDGDGIR